MKAKTTADQFQLIPKAMMPFNLARETLPLTETTTMPQGEMTDQEWQDQYSFWCD